MVSKALKYYKLTQCSRLINAYESILMAQEIKIKDPQQDFMPLLPLRDVVVYPHLVIPLFVGRTKSVKALEIASDKDKKIILVAQKSAS